MTASLSLSQLFVLGEDLLQGKDDGTLAMVKAAEELSMKLQQSFSVTKVFLSMKIVEVKRPLDLMAIVEVKQLEFLRSISLWLINPSNYRGLFGVVFVSVRFDPVCHLMEEWTWQELKYMINWSNKKDDRDFQYMKIYDVIMYNSQVDPIFPLGPRIPKRHFPQGLTTESGVAALAHLQDYSMGLEYDLPTWKPSI